MVTLTTNEAIVRKERVAMRNDAQFMLKRAGIIVEARHPTDAEQEARRLALEVVTETRRVAKHILDLGHASARETYANTLRDLAKQKAA
jgi:hypothetical protein